MATIIDSSVNDPNNIEAYSTKLTILVKQWHGKYGDRWVLVTRIEKGFWHQAFLRLRSNQLFEEAQIGYYKELWVRLK
jgi:hypothetical protein